MVQISSSVLFSDIPQQLNHRQIVWRINIENEQQSVTRPCPAGCRADLFALHSTRQSTVKSSESVWRYLACNANDTPPKVAARLIVEGVRHALTQMNWPENAWFKGSFFSGDTYQRTVRRTGPATRLAGHRAAPFTRHADPVFPAEPRMAPRLLAIANSQVGGMSRPAESAAHALIMLGHSAPAALPRYWHSPASPHRFNPPLRDYRPHARACSWAK